MTPLPENSPDELYLIDGHTDLLYLMTQAHPEVPFEELEGLPITAGKLREADMRVLVSALYCPDRFNGEATSAPFLRGLMDYARKYLTGLDHIRSASELHSCIAEKRTGTIWLIENADGLLETGLGVLEESGIRVAGLTHVGRNRIGDGNAVPFPDGLSSEGKRLVRELSGAGFAFDAAHLAEPGFRDLLRIHEGRIISSHTGVRALADIPRNLTKEQIEVIREREGVIGIAADPDMLAPFGDAKIEDVFQHIDWIAQSFGPAGTAIGTDFCGFYRANEGLEDVSALPKLAGIMRSHGYPEQSVRDIMGGNWRAFYEKLLA
ncbi:MAG: membrane dipeptidase [Desulfobacteraceae bacterium]|nr:membrane dipeptidase [Desulfobacteraceae bacterium]